MVTEAHVVWGIEAVRIAEGRSKPLQGRVMSHLQGMVSVWLMDEEDPRRLNPSQWALCLSAPCVCRIQNLRDPTEMAARLSSPDAFNRFANTPDHLL